MNLPFNKGALAALLLLTVPAFAAQPDPFALVPTGEATYAGLSELVSAGLLPQGSVSAPLTRFEVAKLLRQAEDRVIVLAQADDIPAPDDSDPSAEAAADTPAPEAAPAPAASDSGEFGDELEAAGPSAGSAPGAGVLDDSPEALQKALRTLKTLRQAYDYELGRLKEGLKSLQKQTDNLEAEQFDLRKRLKGIEQYPTVAMHGQGRAAGWWFRIWGNLPGDPFIPTEHGTSAFLDMGPEGHVSKEVRWKSLFRFASGLLPNDNPLFTVRTLEIEFNPPWMDLDICDFKESYTPLTLWNRNSLDLRYVPEHIARDDEWFKYEEFLDREPDWHLRGARASTRAMWDEGSVLESAQASVFAHMVRNGFNDTNGDGWYFGPFFHTDWLLGAKAALSTHDLWLGSSPVKFSVAAHGMMMDQDRGSDAVTAVYDPNNPDTWARQYVIGSVRPEIRLGGEAGLAVCLGMEYAHSFFQDDQSVSARAFNDYAMLGGVALKWGDSSLQLNYLNVGPYFYSPMAQRRQTTPLSIDPIYSDTTGLLAHDIYSGIPRPSDIYVYYDRTEDNTFPYGMATPNREGFGGELDLRFLERDALKLKGSAYYLWEINGNLVVNGTGTGFVPVENPSGPTMFTRTFVYINMGPSVDLGPFLNLPGPLEFGVNARYERTESGFGTLTSLGLLGGFKVDILPVWRLTGSVWISQADGEEAGLAGTLLARYPYLYDATDRGAYTPITINNLQNRTFSLSSAFLVNRNSTIYLEGVIQNFEYFALLPADLNAHIVRLSYEIQF